MAESFPPPNEPVYNPPPVNPVVPPQKTGMSTGAKIAIGCGAALLLCLCLGGLGFALFGNTVSEGFNEGFNSALETAEAEQLGPVDDFGNENDSFDLDNENESFEFSDDSTAYIDNVYNNMVSFNDTLDELNILFVDLENDESLINDDAWRDDVFSALDDLEEYAHEMVAVEPTEEFAETHDWLLEVETEVEDLNENLRTAIEDEDMGALTRFERNAENISEYLTNAADAMPE